MCQAQMQMTVYEDHKLNTKITTSPKSSNAKPDLL